VISDRTVSGLHVEIYLDSQTRTFYLRNLRQINPPLVDNQQVLQQVVPLKVGSIICLGHVQLKVARVQIEVASQPAPPAPLLSDAHNTALGWSQIIPIVSTGRELRRKAHLVPAMITVICVVLLFTVVGRPRIFNFLLAFYIGGAAFYFVYQLCGKRKPWWALMGSAFVTIVVLLSPILRLFIIVFRGILPGNVDQAGSGFLPQLVAHFFGAGLLEELLKAIPILIAWQWGQRLASPLREKVGVWEPLDGILLGAASALGFTWLETLGQYVPNIIQTVSNQSGVGVGELTGLQLLIPRILGSVAGHMAYSGYFGYCIGLSVLKPRKRWQILGAGYLISSGVHALWNSSAALGFWALGVTGILAYAMLAAAILKARQLSPNRNQNFATVVVGFDRKS
jgi:RsiW-degrading membrane proteinase PrsW (M82 family)